VRRANDSSLAANFHALHSNVPTLDDFALSQTELERGTTLGGVKLFVVVFVSANVVNSSLNSFLFNLASVCYLYIDRFTYLFATRSSRTFANHKIFNDNTSVKCLFASGGGSVLSICDNDQDMNLQSPISN